jgi:RimJ/RimL family protein N-acetyltransferase
MGFAEFSAFHRPALEAAEARNYILLGWLERCGRSIPSGFRAWDFETPGVCAIQPVANFAILLGALDKADCRWLAERVQDSAFPGVMGPGKGPHWFAARAAELGLPMRAPLISSIQQISNHPVPPGVPGRARRVMPSDVPVFAEWLAAYMREALPDDPPLDRSWPAQWAADGSYLFWETEGRPVAMAGIYWRTRNGKAITGVYTPPAERGKGYAAAATASLARSILTEGCDRVFLMTRVGNAPALRCYARIGFQPVADFVHYWRDAPPRDARAH